MDAYFNEVKKKLEKSLPDFKSKEFNKIRNNIRKELKKKENEFIFLIKSLKIIVLGDWNSRKKKQKLEDIKISLLRKGIYAQTIDDYYDIKKGGRLTQIQILEYCCVKHQLIVFIDGEGPGTLTEQNYLAENYVFQRKLIYFIEENKFNTIKQDPSQYIRCFPTIITYIEKELIDKAIIYSRFRIYRLAEIIMKQSLTGKGLKNPHYKSWQKRLKKQDIN